MVKKLIYILSIILIIGCTSSDEKKIDVGTIKYAIDYPNPPDDPFILRMMPDTLTMYFKGQKAKSEVVLSSGLIRITFLLDGENRKMTELIKMGFNKMKYEYSKEDFNELMQSFPSYRYQKTSNQPKVLDFDTEEHLAISSNDTISVITTKDIAVNQPNWYNPFKELNGFLISYRMEQFGFLMDLSAKRYVEESLPENIFEVPYDYKAISKEELNKTHNLFMQVGF